MREPNAIDFWRGFALVTIFINHIPGNFFERYTFSQYGISDAAELFVFLAGWSIGLATRGRDGLPEPRLITVLRLLSRTVEVYRAQITIMALALAMIAGCALYLDNPLILEWHNAGGFFADPIQTMVGVVLLTHQLGFFNILPLYVVLIAIAPAVVLIGRVSRVLLLALSLSLYGASLVFEWNFPSWPGEGDWFFDPLCWQLLLVLGFLSNEVTRDSERLRRLWRRLTPLGIVIVIVGVVLAVLELRPDPMLAPEPRLVFTFDKTYLSPARLIHFCGMVLAFQGVYALIAPHVGPLARFLSGLGRNSLAVFSMGSLLSLGGQFVRFQTGGGIFVDISVVGSGLIALGFTAWFVEWRSRRPRPTRKAPNAASPADSPSSSPSA
ncbi:OpgC family protein [Methylorubrum podarium]|uniref:OpgC family protein n=1 Tax=Methylorubrum podarium TaxID=200476 RepID=UPI001EE36C6E|nr:OpgC domain-containing protein [Methylorubrum podarium]GJE69159.1 hypothetical protein CHKEEEPN_0682 [Methylorubrum podarium]